MVAKKNDDIQTVVSLLLDKEKPAPYVLLIADNQDEYNKIVQALKQELVSCESVSRINYLKKQEDPITVIKDANITEKSCFIKAFYTPKNWIRKHRIEMAKAIKDEAINNRVSASGPTEQQ